MKHSLLRLGLTLAVTTFFAACGDDTPTTPTPQPTAASLSSIQTSILTPQCEPCHTDVNRSPAGGLTLKSGATWPNLVNAASSAKAGATRVIPNNASGSYLVQKLEGAADIVGRRMPPTGPPFLTDAQVALIRQWISEGARNN